MTTAQSRMAEGAEATASTQAPTGSATAFDSRLAGRVDTLMTRAVATGLGGAVVLERDRRLLLSSGYGLANRRVGSRFTPDPVAPINSVTKTLTALAVLQLSAKGRVDLQAPLKTYLKSARRRGGVGTIVGRVSARPRLRAGRHESHGRWHSRGR